MCNVACYARKAPGKVRRVNGRFERWRLGSVERHSLQSITTAAPLSIFCFSVLEQS